MEMEKMMLLVDGGVGGGDVVVKRWWRGGEGGGYGGGLGGVGDGLKEKERVMWKVMTEEEEMEFWVILLGEELSPK